MRKITLVVFYSFYLFFLLGFIFHSSSHPDVLGRYTIKYFLYLGFLIILFPFLLILITFLFKATKVKFKGKKYIILPKHKIIILLLASLFLFFSFEILLQNKYKGIDPLEYTYSIENYHPFLQYQPTKVGSDLNISSQNFRGDEIKMEKDENTFRIFVLGGSTVFNSGIKYGDLFSKILQDKLSKQYEGKKIEVLNAGVDGYTSEHSLIQYLFKIKDYNPNLIIYWQGVNDWYYSCSSPLSYGKYKDDYSNFYGASSDMVFDRFINRKPITLNLISLSLINDILSKNLYSDLTNYLNNRNKYKGIYANENFYSFYELGKPQSLKSYERNLNDFVKISTFDGVSLILGNQASIYKKNMTRDERNALFFGSFHCKKNGKYPTLESTKNGLDQFNAISEKIAIENQIDYVDFNSQIPKNLEYFTDDVHYTKKTNNLISEILFKKIVEGSYIK